jgi:hypothetical protein
MNNSIVPNDPSKKIEKVPYNADRKKSIMKKNTNGIIEFL